MQYQNTASKEASQVFDQQPASRAYGWVRAVKRTVRADHGREVCKQNGVSPRLVAELAERFSSYPSFKNGGELFAGQEYLAISVRVHERQVRRAIRVLKTVGLLRVERRGLGRPNKMIGVYDDRLPLSGNPATASFTCENGLAPKSSQDRPRKATQDQPAPSSNLNGGVGRRSSTSPLGPSNPGKSKTPTAREEDEAFSARPRQ